MNRTDAATHLALMTTSTVALEVATYHLPYGAITAAELLESAEDASWSRAGAATDEEKAEAVRILTLLSKLA
jgi:hypothetical protein